MKLGQFFLGVILGGLVVFCLFRYTTNEVKNPKIPDEIVGASKKWPWADSLDALKAAPDNHKLIYEDSSVRVLMVTLDHNKSEPIHTHKWSSIMWIAKPIVPCQITNYVKAEGKFVKADSVLIKEMKSNIGQLIGPEGPTSITNLGNSDGIAYRIEFKRDFEH